ncbi:major facilitator superfamily MFS_1 [Beutenbergia cavernae DSM 12333]|uniref:Major facilitator superfamily MFS_1 n=1 Tax=Beutenbergia cavernae (strain ATCC BAA-8 / DSM 12333 / CCUG 43141 / JCM 11478 / NBRC 16432 / NCIMB 13614 / HKI 0122) TaxID=471853 RepID=C5C0J7_BEUC1|nr:MFS transporter [Beutenbergia cavernae]ACQ81393.1 major facilitator superfamily MFS_1 [Beutenbergia cavernae DSM 12333]
MTNSAGAHAPSGGGAPAVVDPRRGASALRYGVGMFGTSLPINMFRAYMTIYYVDELGLDTYWYGIVMVAYAIIDAVDNPVFGYLTDRTRSRWGRRKPWLVVGAPVLALALVVFFSPPENASDVVILVWFAVFAIGMETVDSLINASYGALLPEMFPGERERAKANAVRQAFQLAAMVIGIALTPIVVDLLGYATTAIVYGVVAAAVILWSALGAKENPAVQTEPGPRIWDSVKVIFSTAKFWAVAITGGLYAGATGLIIAAIPFLAEYTLVLAAWQTSVLFASVLLVAVACLPLWTAVVRRRGALWTWQWALVAFAVAMLPMLLARDFVVAVVCGIVIGVGYSGVLATADLVVAKLLDEDTLRTGVHREGMFLAAIGFFNRLNGLVRGAAFVLAGALFGFRSGDNPGDRPDQAGLFLAVVAPAAFLALAAIAARFVRFDDDVTPPDIDAVIAAERMDEQR